MRQHIRAALKEAKRHGGRAEYIPRTGHGDIVLTDPDGRECVMKVSTSPRCLAHVANIVRGQVRKFMKGGDLPRLPDLERSHERP